MLNLPEDSKRSRDPMRQSEHVLALTDPPTFREIKQVDLLALPPPREELRAFSAELDRLFTENLPALLVIARRTYKLLPDHVPFAAIYCAGIRGLVGALDRFEPGDEVRFRELAKSYIWKAILGELQRLVWTTEDLRRKGSPIETAIHQLTAKLHRSPTEYEISRQLQIDVAAYHCLLDELIGIEIGIHHSAVPNGSVEKNIVNLANLPESHPQLRFQGADMQERLAYAIKDLPERERLVLSLSYCEGLNLGEIGFVLDELESDVSRIHASAILRLRSSLSEFGYS
jgi:RNA polymerase sigma factor FliA